MNDKSRHNSPQTAQDQRIEPNMDSRAELHSDAHAQSLSGARDNGTCTPTEFDPSDQMHLMAFADGELQGEQHERVRRHVQQNPRDEAVLQGIWQLGDWVRHTALGRFEQATQAEQGWDDALGEQITSTVMGEIEQVDGHGDATRPQVADVSKDGTSRKNAVISLQRKRGKRTATRAQSGYKSATLFSVAAVVCAAAAGVVLLLRVGVFTPVHQVDDNAAGKASGANAVLAVSAAVSSGNTSVGPTKDRGDSSHVQLADSSADEELSPTAAVNAVDFGSRTGTVFYVPNDTGSATTVVWVTDEELGGN